MPYAFPLGRAWDKNQFSSLLAGLALLGERMVHNVIVELGKSVFLTDQRLTAAVQSPDFPPCFSSTRTFVMTMPRSAALHMS